ncbi:MAG: phosphatase PAP2 family protein [Anaerolineaceae bacterium]|nr:phosphatase PAP2 family protein [Anaerolineaceae bacterium]
MDTSINIFLQSLGTWLQGLSKLLSFLGTETFYILVMPAVYWCVDALAGLRLGMILVLSGTLNGLLKLIFKMPRPYWVDSRVKSIGHEKSFGLPSGHAMNAAALWGQLSREFRQRWITWACIALIVLIGLSRLVLGVHFTLDVTLGWVLGLAVLLLFNHYYAPVACWVKRMPFFKQIGLAFLSSLLFVGLVLLAEIPGQTWKMPAEWAAGAGAADPFSPKGLYLVAGLWFGFLGGFLALRKHLGILQSHQGGFHLLWRYLLGLAGIILIYMGMGKLIPKELNAFTFVLVYLHASLLGFWISCIAPILFKALGIANFRKPEQA